MLFFPNVDKVFDRLKPVIYDDIVDRLNYFISTLLLIFFALMIAGKQYVGAPIQCWLPAQFKGGWEQYTEDYCFIENTFYLPFVDPVPHSLDEREDKEIHYYQWVPIVMVIQALMFYVPNFIWKCFASQSGICLKSILLAAHEDKHQKSHDDRKKNDQQIAFYIRESLGCDKHTRSSGFLCCRVGSNLGSFLSCLYLIIKVLYLVNIALQFWIMNTFIGAKYRFWGLQILMDLLSGKEWSLTGHFPRVTFCDFDVRVLGNVQHHTVQCVLMINMFNEKIYLVLWFWCLIVGVVTLFNTIYWVFQLLLGSSRVGTIHKFLKISPGPLPDRRSVSDFVNNYLKPDGVLTLKFVGAKGSEMVAGRLARALYEDFEKDDTHSRGSAPYKGGSPNGDEGFVESPYEVDGARPLLGNPEKGYPGPPPPIAPKPKLMDEEA